jgi:hypothetical protein
MRAARHGSAWSIGCSLNLTQTLTGDPRVRWHIRAATAMNLFAQQKTAAKKTLASPRPRPKIGGEAGVLPGADYPRSVRQLRTDPLNLAGPVPVKGVRYNDTTRFESG